MVGSAWTRSIALWSGLGGAICSLGPLLSGALLLHFWWGWVFLITLPLAVVALALAIAVVPSHVNEATDPVDHLGGILVFSLFPGRRQEEELLRRYQAEDAQAAAPARASGASEPKRT